MTNMLAVRYFDDPIQESCLAARRNGRIRQDFSDDVR
jgi:hypothetical protein